MADSKPQRSEQGITRERLAELLNEDLSREYQAIIAYVAYSEVLKGATNQIGLMTADQSRAGQRIRSNFSLLS
jgi:hypothetical protein